LKSLDGKITGAVDFPVGNALVGDAQVDDKFFIPAVLVGVSVKSTAQRRGQLCIDFPSIQKNLIVARRSGLVRVAEGGTKIIRIHLTIHRYDGNIAKIPMSLVRVRKAVNDRVLVFVTCATAELRDGAQLHHRVRQRCAWKRQSP